MTRDDYVDLVERRYFGNVAQADIPAVVACFTDDALVTIYHGDAAPRLFKLNPAPARPRCPASSSICSPTTTRNSTEFVHYVDTGGERCAATFLVTLTPKPDSTLSRRRRAALAQLQLLPLPGRAHPRDDHLLQQPRLRRRRGGPRRPPHRLSSGLAPGPHHGAMHGVRRLRHSFASCGARTSGPRRAR